MHLSPNQNLERILNRERGTVVGGAQISPRGVIVSQPSKTSDH